jgi:hypothetical protein
MTDRDELCVNRRWFCQQVVYVGFGSYLALASGACRSRSEREAAALPEGSGLLTPTEAATLAAACERLFPVDEDPGAIALGAPAFVDRQLTSEAFWGWRKAFQRSLAELDGDAQARYQRSFARLAAGEQDALLDAWIHGPKPRATFVSRLMHLTLEGVFCDPSHGGNKGGAAWALVGFAPSSPRPGDLHRM